MKNIERLPSGTYRVKFNYHGEPVTGLASTEFEAIELRDELKRQILDGDLAPAKGMTAKDLGPRFLGSRLGNRTSDNDTNRWNKHVAGAPWARKSLVTVTRADGVAWLKLLRRKRVGFDPEKHGEREVKTLAWQTRKHCMNLARSFFAWAIDQEAHGLPVNPFAGLKVEREDGDEDAGYQEGWYLEPKEAARFFGTWDRKDVGLDEGDRAEKWIAVFAAGTGLRLGEAWCLHLDDVHVGKNESRPRVEVRFGSWDSAKGRYRAPKGRKGEKKNRTVFLFGHALEAARTWLAGLRVYAPKNPLGLMFPTERGALRTSNPRSWKKVVEAFGVVPRIGRKVWWHLLRHTCASSLISGWWGMRWSLEDVSKVLGHTDVRTTQIYAHLAPSAIHATAVRAQAAFHAVSTAARLGSPSARNDWHALYDSNIRHSASKASNSPGKRVESASRGDCVETILHALRMVRDGVLPAEPSDVAWLTSSLDLLLAQSGQEADRTA